MPINASSYGTTEMVAALVPLYAPTGGFTVSTRPTLTQCETWINQMSGVVNTLLAEAGFSVPVTQANAVEMLASLVTSAVADIADYSNRTGRFLSAAAQERGLSISKVLRNEISEWINIHAKGLENLGAARTEESGVEIGFREADQAGDTVPPLFQRKAFGDVTQDWDV